ncbi:MULTISPECIES: ATP-binding protein [Pseudoalteromonas]|uniref:ATP-binding protein n=1 Tax=Pseudoalteromonas TaxID=53246 RepID=UPI0015C6A49A|nr:MULTISPECIES: ATP-binding protein [Pseudoalteromonas]MBB1371690.1 sensor histidine kinase N-terminal domain-containing protein [Pseudoalteromonas sp. SR45-4]MBE0421665.1 sensor histidine kinase N-terminal domain-containing protein [Pseudoalteromonas nigrifaciens]MBH0072176.1 sensor histidine kinase N-terminal domain-containing protein [Pseudoalteromonas sp. NZS127]NYR13460.1 two-component sensor histidine kinase [Pseudoalteromonas sp. MIP2626]|tara:strand:+ start:11171 stop:12484 length:1314 start_codon:yes stop_codon:yes gene_type:complete
MSIRKRLTLILLSMMVLTCFLALVKGYQKSMHHGENLLDNELKIVAGVLIEQPLALTTNAAQVSSNSAQLLYQIWHNNRLLSGSSSLSNNCVNFSEGLQTANLAGQRMRVFVMRKNTRKVIVAEPMAKRFELAEAVILSAMLPMLWAVPLLAIFISFFVKYALAPLTRLSRQLASRQANDFTPINWQVTDEEIKPVINRLNDLFKRVETAYLRERFFASDAAHELRTPLSSLKINVHNLANKQSNSQNNQELKAMSQGINRLSNIVEQMLILGRTQPEQWQKQFSEQSLLTITQQAVSEQYDKIDEKNQTISLEGNDFVINGDEFTLTTLISNLLSNAIKYTPNDGQIIIKLASSNNDYSWQIDDSGSGMTEEQKDRIFNRFYRVGGDQHPSGEQGAGLGMAIVQHIIAIYDANIHLANSHLGGLTVKITFTGVKSD